MRAAAVLVAAAVAIVALAPAEGQVSPHPARATGTGTRAPLAGTRDGAPPPDTLRLDALQEEAARLDPRSRALALQERASEARIDALGRRWLPRLDLAGSASYQTDVPDALGASGGLPPGFEVPVPPKDRYEAALEVDQLLWDGGRGARREAVERSRLAERQAETRSSLHAIREELDTAFFGALLAQERRSQLELLIEDLEARRRLAAARVEAGALVPAELAAVEAELLGARQALDESETARTSALRRLEALTGRGIGPGAVLAVPGIADAAGPSGSLAGDSLPPWSSRPEWERLRRAEERLRAEAAVAGGEDAPRASAFVRGAYGRPGLDFFDDAFSPYASAGIRISWSLFDGGTSGSEASALRMEADAAAAERAALGAALSRRVRALRAEIERLERALETDDRLVELRETRERTALRQLEEGVLLPADYLERRTELFDARLRRRTHRVRLAEARARLLTVLGRPLPGGETGAGLAVPIDPEGPRP